MSTRKPSPSGKLTADSPHRFHDPEYVTSWAAEANDKRPYRQVAFEAFARELQAYPRARVLELGSGPGFLAEHLLQTCDIASYTLFDFSKPMLELARRRLRKFGDIAVFREGSFLEEGWSAGLEPPFDVVVSLQAVHEQRDPSLAPGLYRLVKSLLSEPGIFCVGDLTGDDGDPRPYFLTARGQQEALATAGFSESRVVLEIGDLALVVARP